MADDSTELFAEDLTDGCPPADALPPQNQELVCLVNVLVVINQNTSVVFWIPIPVTVNVIDCSVGLFNHDV